MIKMIWAQSSDLGIGLSGGMPWHIPEDFAHFKRETMGSTVIMGRTSWDALPSNTKPLPGRNNIIITHHLNDEVAENIKSLGGVASTFDDALSLAKTQGAYIIGGAKIYTEFMQYADELIVTEIDKAFEVDTYAPEIPDRFKIHNKSDWQQSKAGICWRVVNYKSN